MKIDSSITPLTSTGVKEGQGRPPAPAGAGAAQQPQTAQDSVQLSSAAKLQTLGHGLENVPAVDTAKVEAIKQAIAEGRFAINPEAIADGLIATAKDLVLKEKD